MDVFIGKSCINGGFDTEFPGHSHVMLAQSDSHDFQC